MTQLWSCTATAVSVLVYETCLMRSPGFHTGLFGGEGGEVVGHCHSVMHEYAEHVLFLCCDVK